MKRKIPVATGWYLGPDAAAEITSPDSNAYVLWARAKVGDTSVGPVRIIRVATHEVPGTKWVEFEVLPELVLFSPGARLYAAPEFTDTQSLYCDWSDFLRLTRWRKQVDGHPADIQARIACVLRGDGNLPHASSGLSWRLVAVDDPIRKELK